MFADGDAEVRRIIADALRGDPAFVARGCASAREALDAARHWQPDMIVLGLNMPGANDPVFIARLRMDCRTAAVPVVFAAARRPAREGTDIRALGAVGMIEKPLDAGTLAAQLHAFVPLNGALALLRTNFLQRLDADARALADCRDDLLRAGIEAILARINAIAHALAGAGGIYGFHGISGASAALSDAAEECLAGRASREDVVDGLDRLLERIHPDHGLARPLPRARRPRLPQVFPATVA
ncbi:MAG: response regulator [Xanthobacteraceae bacterium]